MVHVAAGTPLASDGAQGDALRRRLARLPPRRAPDRPPSPPSSRSRCSSCWPASACSSSPARPSTRCRRASGPLLDRLLLRPAPVSRHDVIDLTEPRAAQAAAAAAWSWPATRPRSPSTRPLVAAGAVRRSRPDVTPDTEEKADPVDATTKTIEPIPARVEQLALVGRRHLPPAGARPARRRRRAQGAHQGQRRGHRGAHPGPRPVRRRRAGHRLHPRPDRHPLRGRARPGRQGRADHGADQEHRLRGGERRTCAS